MSHFLGLHDFAVCLKSLVENNQLTDSERRRDTLLGTINYGDDQRNSERGKGILTAVEIAVDLCRNPHRQSPYIAGRRRQQHHERVYRRNRD